MYEAIKYDELKQLPDDQKKAALKELMTTYGSNKAIAEATGGATIAIANMYGKFVEGKKIGRVKGSKNSKKAEESKEEKSPEISTETPIIVSEEKPKRKYTRKVKEDAEAQQDISQQETKPDKTIELPEINEVSNVPTNIVDVNSFSIIVNKTVSGENAHFLLNGLANTLIKDQQYILEFKITEK